MDKEVEIFDKTLFLINILMSKTVIDLVVEIDGIEKDSRIEVVIYFIKGVFDENDFVGL